MKVVVFIDVQNDFVKGGALPYAYPEEPNHQKIVEFANECRKRGYAMFATLDTHYPSKDAGCCHTAYAETYEGKNLPIEHCIIKTEGHRLIEGLSRTTDAMHFVNIPRGHQIMKEAFGTDQLVSIIRSNACVTQENIEEIVLCGYCTSICVVSNALVLRAAFPNTPITVIGELCGDIDKESHFAALKVMHNCMIFNKAASAVLDPQDAS
jgi:nicotinamidase-related amidase